MPDKRKHRGQHPADAKLFGSPMIPILKQAIEDLSWLMSQGYPEKASLKLVGDRFRLKERQREAIIRCACTAEAKKKRQKNKIVAKQLQHQPLAIDGFNLLITIESALSNGMIFDCMDGCYRDLASIHGTYKRVMETEKAIMLIGKGLETLGVGPVHWLLDRPVSNSGRMKTFLYETADQKEWDWEVDLCYNPDARLTESDDIIVSSDSMVIDGAGRWTNFARYCIDTFIPHATILHFGFIQNP